jgi:hypothetical protein
MRYPRLLFGVVSKQRLSEIKTNGLDYLLFPLRNVKLK